MNFAVITNFVIFQIGWFSCVLGGAHNWPWLGTLVAALLIVIHLWRVPSPTPELKLLLIAGMLGIIFDSLLVTFNLLQFPSGTLVEGMAPHWIIAMWMMFATTLNVTFRWLKGQFILAALLGAIAGPLAYYGGAKLGGVMFNQFTLSLIVLALIWGSAMPLLMWLSDRFDGTVETTHENA